MIAQVGTPRRLSKPPIREALIDIRTASDPAVDLERLKGIKADLISKYPLVEEKRAFKAELRVESGKVLPPSAEDLGFAAFVFSAADKKRLVQIRRDGFTVNHVGDYRDADELMRDALDVAVLYWRIAAPVAITRIAMRYINALNLPYGPGEDFRKYLTVPPDMPEGTPQLASSFLSRMVAHDGDDVVVLTQKMDESVADGTTPVTIDLDVFYEGQTDARLEEVSSLLKRLRTLNNRTFFALLTDEALELYT